MGHSYTDWNLAPAVLVSALATAALFVQGWVRLRRRGRADHASWWRAGLFGCALTAGTLALVSPLDHVGENYLLSGHMLQHVVIGDLAPALALVALRGPLTFFLLPPSILGPLARVSSLRAVARFLLRPRVAFAFWAVTILGWHVPRVYEYALAHTWAHDLEHASFILAGVLAWAQLVDPARRRELGRGGRVAFAVAIFVVGQALADALVFSGTPFYEPYVAQHERVLGLSPLADQRVAGLVMMLEQLATLGTCVAILLWPLLTRRERPALTP